MAMTIAHVQGTVVAASVPERTLPEPGDRFGGYQIVRTLGKGGMGAVFEADQLETGRRVALKVLKHSLDSPEARKRFLREGRLAASINHPNSVYVFGTEEIEGTPAIAMELVAGGTLQERVKKSGPLPTGEAVDVVLQIIAGLEAAQKLGVLHRDIKPANCFVDLAGNIKVGDFGLSISTSARDQTEVTQNGVLLGTPAFSSPEQLRGDELNVRSDLYSVGVTLYYLLTGHTPFEADNVVKLLATVLEQRAESPRKHRSEIPQRLAAITLRCLQKQPSERFKDYAELRKALLPFASAAPTPGTLGLRWMAYVIDCMLLACLQMSIEFSVINDLDQMNNAQWNRSAPILLMSIGMQVLRISYFAISEGFWGLTPGRALCRLRVVGPDRATPGVGRALIRAAIFCLLPVVPLWVNFFDWGDSVAVSLASSILSWIIFLGLFATARRSNGYAGLHELASGTRVISHESFQTRSMLAATDDLPPSASPLPLVGPYHVLQEIGPTGEAEWLLGYDTRLLRRVWIHKLPDGAPPVSAKLRGLGRVGRLRWLTGHRSPGENWDAYEAVPGQPLVALLEQRHPWREVRFWLLDLAEELTSSARDETSPSRLSPDQVWITTDGRAKLLDFPVPGTQPLPVALAQSLPPGGDMAARRVFLHQVAVSSLEGQPPHAASDALVVPSLPLPMRARNFFETLATNTNVELPLPQLRELVQTGAEVTHTRRLLLLLALCLPSVLIAIFGMFIARMYEQSVKKHPDIQPLMIYLHHLDDLKQPRASEGAEQQDGPTKREKIAAMEKYIAYRFGSTIRDRQQWNSTWVNSSISPQHRALAEKILADHPNVTQVEFEAAEKVVHPMMGKLEAGTKLMGSNAMSLFMVMAAGGWLISTAFFSLSAAVLCRGGLLLWALGLTFVRWDGKPASRLRILWRAIVAWFPLFVAPFAVALIIQTTAETTPKPMSPDLIYRLITGSLMTMGIIYLALVAISALLPVRGIPDRLAGTWLVPR
jgi:serine/threonine protein kinase